MSTLVLVAVVVLSGCAGGDGEVVAGGAGDAAPPSVDTNAPFSLWLSADRVPPGPAEVVAVLVSHGGADATFGVGATVDRWVDGDWVSHGQLVMCLDHWHCTARMQDAEGGLDTPSIGLSAAVDRPGEVERFTTEGLDVGWYRIAQQANEGVAAAGILEVAEGAPAPPPLAAVNEPAISVQPPLVEPGGGSVTLQPLIPPVAGSQSIEDVEAGVEGLSESAAIERWEGGSWVPVAEIGLEPAPAPPLYSRTAALPALPVGEYRLVRSGPDGGHVGRFWVAPSEAPATPSEDVRLTDSGACGDAHFWAATSTGDVAVTLSVDARERAVDKTTTIPVWLPDPAVTVEVLRGAGLARNFCTDLPDLAADPTATLAAVSGEGEVVLEPPSASVPTTCGGGTGILRLSGLVAGDGTAFAPFEVTSHDIGCYAG